MGIKLMKTIKKAQKTGDMWGNMKAAKNGQLTKHLAKKKAKKSFFKLFK